MAIKLLLKSDVGYKFTDIETVLTETLNTINNQNLIMSAAKMDVGGKSYSLDEVLDGVEKETVGWLRDTIVKSVGYNMLADALDITEKSTGFKPKSLKEIRKQRAGHWGTWLENALFGQYGGSSSEADIKVSLGAFTEAIYGTPKIGIESKASFLTTDRIQAGSLSIYATTVQELGSITDNELALLKVYKAASKMANFVLIEMRETENGNTHLLGINTIELFLILILKKLYNIIGRKAEEGVALTVTRSTPTISKSNAAWGLGNVMVINYGLNLPDISVDRELIKIRDLYLRHLMLFDRNSRGVGSESSREFWKNLNKLQLFNVDEENI